MKSARQRAPLPVRFEKRDERCSPEKKYTGSRARTGKGITVKFLFCAIEPAILSSQAGAFHVVAARNGSTPLCSVVSIRHKPRLSIFATLLAFSSQLPFITCYSKWPFASINSQLTTYRPFIAIGYVLC